MQVSRQMLLPSKESGYMLYERRFHGTLFIGKFVKCVFKVSHVLKIEKIMN